MNSFVLFCVDFHLFLFGAAGRSTRSSPAMTLYKQYKHFILLSFLQGRCKQKAVSPYVFAV